VSLPHPLDPAFPIERHLEIDVPPVGLASVFTLAKAGEQIFSKPGKTMRPS
jgi:hypothetical protein